MNLDGICNIGEGGSETAETHIRIGVVGLGYVGLPLALAFAKEYPFTIGYDIDERRISQIKQGIDPCHEGYDSQIRETRLQATSEIADLAYCNFFCVTVPTPVDHDNRPDLSFVIQASRMVGKVMPVGSTVVFESTVYPGVTEEICRNEIAAASGLRPGIDFKMGYSPERINPGDQEHSLDRVVKIVSGEDESTLELVANVYKKIVRVGVHKAPSIRVAEAAKVVENTQRDLNIALMNELAVIFDRMNVRTSDVLEAAGSKWNFLKFSPGLVGGHCIGVDPYYLTSKAEQLGYLPQVILAGRRVNDTMGHFIATRFVKLMAKNHKEIVGARVGILGLTFKENVSDIRNSRVPSIITELKQYNAQIFVCDPHADAGHAKDEYGLELFAWDDICELDGLIFAVAHKEFLEHTAAELWAKFGQKGGCFMDIKSIFKPQELPSNIIYWSL